MMHGQQNFKFKQTLLFEVRAEAEEMVDDVNKIIDDDQYHAVSKMSIIIDSKYLTKLRRSLTVCCVKHVKSR